MPWYSRDKPVQLPTIAADIPETPKPSHHLVVKIWSFIHVFLRSFSEYYMRWFKKPMLGADIWPLPFGLVLKWSQGTRLEEVLSMQVARAAGLPVPRVISYGEHPDVPWAPMSILMTQVPGCSLGEVYDQLSLSERTSILYELKFYMDAIRRWRSPTGRLCSVNGTAIRSHRVPKNLVGPCETERQFAEYLLSPAGGRKFRSQVDYETTLANAQSMTSIPHKIVFSHGDLAQHNIFVHKGHISGIIDWETSGWLPEYWEYTTAWRLQRSDGWWFQFVKQLADGKYQEELEYDRALLRLTCDSFHS